MSIDVGLRIQGGQETERTAADLVKIRTSLQELANTSESVNRLAKTLKLTSAEAQDLAKSMGLTADQVNNIAKKFTLLEASTGTSSKKLQQLTKELSPEQFDKFSAAISKAAANSNKALEESAQKSTARVKETASKLNFVDEASRLTFALNNVLQAYKAISEGGKVAFELLIAGTEKLKKTTLSAQTSLAASTTISVGGEEVTDPIKKIQASRDKIAQALDQIELDTQNLVGVTPEKANEVYKTILANITSITGQSQKNSDALANATDLTGRLAAALQVANVPIAESSNQIGQILRAEIERENVLARTLGITQQDALLWKQQGVLVDKVVEKSAVALASNKLGAQSIENVASNLEALTARLARDIGKPLFEPVLQGLTELQNYLLQNRVAITEFFEAIIVNAGSSAGAIAENLQPTFEAIYNLVLEAGPTLALLFQLIGEGLVNTSAAIGPLLTALVNIIATATRGIGLLIEAIQLREINNLNDTLEQSRTQSDALSDSALKTATALKALADVKNKNPEQIAEQKKQNELAQLEIQNIEAKITYLKQLPKIGAENAANIQSQINQLTVSRKLLIDNAGQIDLSARKIEKLGDNYEQVGGKVKGVLQTIAANGQGNIAKLNEAFGQLTDLTKQQVEQGQITVEQATKQLDTIVKNDSATVDSRKKAISLIIDLRKQQTDLEASQLQAEAVEIENAGKARVGNELETARQITAIRVKQQEQQLSVIAEAIAREEELISQKKGSVVNLNKLKADARKQEAEIAKVKIDAQLEQERIAVDLIERETKKADAKIILSQTNRLQAVKAQELAATRSKVIDQAKIEQESQRQVLEIQGETLAKQLENKRTELEKIKAVEATATGANKRQLLVKEQELSQEIAKLTTDRIDNELSKVKLARDIELKIILDNEARRKQASDALIAGLDIEIGKRQILQKSIESQYNVELAALERVTRALQLQNDLTSAKTSLQQASIGLSQAQGDVSINLLRDAANARKELDAGGITDSRVRLALEAQIRAATGNSSENQLRIAERIFRQEEINAKLKLDQIYVQQQAARVELENKQRIEQLEQRRNETDAKRQVNIANLAVIEAQITAQKVQQSNLAAIQAIQAELAVATAKNDKVAIDAANTKLATQQQQNQLQTQQADQNVGLAKTAVSEAEKNLVSVQQQGIALTEINSIAKDTLLVQQQTELTLANQAEYSRQLAANLTIAKEQAAYYAPQALPARKDGGYMAANQPFIGGEVGAEPVRYNDGTYGYLPTPGIYKLPKPGMVIPANQISTIVQSPSIGINSMVQHSLPSADILVREIRALRDEIKSSSGVIQHNSFDLVDDDKSYRRAAEIAIQVARVNRGLK
jgi:hypothetical protein